ncbi:MAG: DUF1634 domain-containing protein [Thermoprotei archaeon]
MKFSIEKAISYSLITGVIISSSLIILGLAFIFAQGSAGPYAFAQISSFTSTINSKTFGINEVFSGLRTFNGISYIYLGIMVLITTPVIRVVLLIAQFLYERNKLYFIISTLVLFNILFALLVLPRFLSRCS